MNTNHLAREQKQPGVVTRVCWALALEFSTDQKSLRQCLVSGKTTILLSAITGCDINLQLPEVINM